MKRQICLICILLLLLCALPVSAVTEPEITLQPQNYHYPEYSTAIYTVKASGSNLSAVWYLSYEGKTYNLSDNTNGMEPWEAYAGENYGGTRNGNTFTYFFGGIEEELNGAEIWCVIEDGHYDVTSDKAIITIQGSYSPPEILNIPAKVTAELGEYKEIRCLAKSNGQSQLQYLWYETTTGRLQDIKAIMPEEDCDFLLCDTTSAGTRYFVCAVMGSDGGMVYSSVVPVTVKQGVSVAEPEIITIKLPDATAGENYYVKLECTDPDASFGISYNPGKANDFDKTGLNLTQHGEIEGVPAKAGTYGFTVCAAGEGGEGYQAYTLTVKEAEATEPEQTEATEPTQPVTQIPETPTEGVGSTEAPVAVAKSGFFNFGIASGGVLVLILLVVLVLIIPVALLVAVIIVVAIIKKKKNAKRENKEK